MDAATKHESQGGRKKVEKIKVRRDKSGKLLAGDAERRKEIEDFFPNLYTAHAPPHGVDRSKQATEEEMDRFPRKITANRVRRCVARMKKNKTCDEEDGLVAEMLQEAPAEIMEAIAKTFEDRVRRGPNPDDDAWDEYDVTLQKVLSDMASKFRGIAIIPCLRKLYFATLADAMGYDDIDLGEHQFAFRKGYQAAEVLFILRQLGEKGQ